MSAKKIVCLGGGSLYFRRALPDLMLSEDLAGSEIALYDIDAEKVERMAAMGSVWLRVRAPALPCVRLRTKTMRSMAPILPFPRLGVVARK